MITLRDGKKEDAPFIAKMIMAALHIDFNKEEKMYQHVIKAVEDENTLYSWNRCVVAIDDEECVGLCLAYNAKDYHERRIHTFTMPFDDGKSFADNDPTLLEQEDEASEGEYYIDSLAVTTNHRKQGIGRTLLQHAIIKGKELRLTPTLLVDPNNINAVKLYSSLCFHYERDIFAFGQTYHKYRWKST